MIRAGAVPTCAGAVGACRPEGAAARRPR